MKKDLKDITEDEVRTICEIYNEPYLSYMAGKWTYGLAVQINTTSTATAGLKIDKREISHKQSYLFDDFTLLFERIEKLKKLNEVNKEILNKLYGS